MQYILKHKKVALFSLILFVLLPLTIFLLTTAIHLIQELMFSQQKTAQLTKELNNTQKEYLKLKNADQYVRNEKLQKQIQDIEKTYSDSVVTYEDLLKLHEVSKKTQKQDDEYTQVINFLAKRNYASASAALISLKKEIADERAKIASSFSIPQNVPEKNTPPGAGYARQVVKTSDDSYLVDIVAADLNSTKVVVDTASDGDCGDNCPVAALGDFVARSGGYAGINGPYFCPASYPSCAGKTNSFDTLIMNKNKVYFNSNNNVYSTVPALIFSAGSGRLVSRSLEWGRDTGPDSVIASQPMLVQNGEITYGGDDEVKRAGKGARSFIGFTGNTVYIGVVYNANVAEVARVLKTMNIQNALNLDSGGSTALWSGGYIAGPGRNTPFGIVFVRR